MNTEITGLPPNVTLCGPDIFFKLLCQLTGQPYSVSSALPPTEFAFNGWVFKRSDYLGGNQIITENKELGEELEKLFPQKVKRP